MKLHLKGTQHGGVEEVVTVVLNELKDYQGSFESGKKRWIRCVELKEDY